MSARALVLTYIALVVLAAASFLAENTGVALGIAVVKAILIALVFMELWRAHASDRMIADTYTQFLRHRNWTKVLMLVGKQPRDKEIAAPIAHAGATMDSASRAKDYGQALRLIGERALIYPMYSVGRNFPATRELDFGKQDSDRLRFWDMRWR